MSTSAPATIAVVGTSYVGLSLAMLLARHNSVRAHDIDERKIAMLQGGRSPISDPDIERFLGDGGLDISFTTSPEAAYAEAEFVIIATPTNYDPQTNYFDTRSVESVIADVVRINPKAVMVIKSTIPVGFTDGVRARLGTENVIFSPNSSGRAGPSMTTCTRAASSSARSAIVRSASLTCCETPRKNRMRRSC